MNEECMDAQRIISEGYDGEPIDPGDIQRARKHCAECPECADFVTAMAAMRRVQPPTAPPKVVQNAIATLRAEAARLAETKTAETEAAEQAAAPFGEQAVKPLSAEDRGRAAARPSQSPWFAWGGWVAAAAAVVLVVGILTVQGVNYIARDSEEEAATIVEAENAAPTVGQAPPASGADESLRSAEGADYITVDGLVYRFTGRISSLGSAATTVGSTFTALDTDSAPKQYSVASAGEDRLAIDTDTGTYGFELVTRTLRGVDYAMQSRPVTSFSQWPSLPEGFVEPTREDGSPTFSRSTTDDSGVPVFTAGESDPSGGFAVAPDTSSSDPAAGNPNWTWWVPVE